MLGQKYGYRPLPAKIGISEYELIHNNSDLCDNDIALLDRWYRKDDNAIPAVYLLQPISSILRNFNNKVSKIRYT